MSKSLLQQKWFSQISLHAASKLLRDEHAGLRDLEKSFLGKFFWHYLQASPEIVGEIDDFIAFFAFAFLQRRRSHAQILQDLWVLFQTNEMHEGFFVEFGACDGVKLSNTLLLEQDYSWRGILSEPDPVWHDALQVNRSAKISSKCVHQKSGETISFQCSTDPELSRIADVVPNDVHELTGTRSERQRVDVETISLIDLLREEGAPENIDYLSIDTEGSEELILRDFDFEAFRFRCITVEHAGDQKKRDAIYNLLTKNGYDRWHTEMSRWDDWYTSLD